MDVKVINLLHISRWQPIEGHSKHSVHLHMVFLKPSIVCSTNLYLKTANRRQQSMHTPEQVSSAPLKADKGSWKAQVLHDNALALFILILQRHMLHWEAYIVQLSYKEA